MGMSGARWVTRMQRVNPATGNSEEKQSDDGRVEASGASGGLQFLSPDESSHEHEKPVATIQWCTPSSSR